MEYEEILKRLCEAHAPSGRENWIQPVVEEIFQPIGNVNFTDLNNTYVYKKGNGKNSIMLMAHIDEVFLMITEISDNGFLKFRGNGIDVKTLVSQEIIIHGKKDIPGVIGIKPPHLMSDEEKNKAVTMDGLLIDTGYSRENLEKLVHVGDFVTIKRDFVKLLNDNVSCKAIDDRAAVAAMYVCGDELRRINHDLDVYLVASCQEEVGHRGAKMAAYDINPTIAIAIDATFDSGILGDGERDNKIGGGPVICAGPNIHPKLRKKIIEIAKEYGIPFGVEVEPGNTGTDAWDIQVAREGIPTLLISIPIKYMHTSVEMVNMEDIKNTGRLMAKFIEKLRDEELEGVLCY